MHQGAGILFLSYDSLRNKTKDNCQHAHSTSVISGKLHDDSVASSVNGCINKTHLVGFQERIPTEFSRVPEHAVSRAVLFLKKDFINLFLEKGKGREKERERSISVREREMSFSCLSHASKWGPGLSTQSCSFYYSSITMIRLLEWCEHPNFAVEKSEDIWTLGQNTTQPKDVRSGEKG